MRYIRNENRDAYYSQQASGRKVKSLSFTYNPSKQRAVQRAQTIGVNAAMPSMYTCTWCKTSRHFREFARVRHDGFFTICWDPRDENQKTFNTTVMCIHCLCALFDSVKAQYELTDLDALYIVCALANIYYDVRLATLILKDKDPRFYDDVELTSDVHFIDKYTRKLEEDLDLPTSFWGEKCSPFEVKKVYDTIKNAEITGTDEDRDNYNRIWAMYHYDPFETESPKDKPRLMANLVTMMDDAMNGDLVRMSSALEIVRAYYRIEKMGEKLNELTAAGADQNSNVIKQLTAAKTQETTMVTNFCKDNGFAAKYATAKSKGSGTLSAVIRDMRDANYDFGTVNKYDIETSAAIKQVSDISAESIFKQVGFSSADYADMVREQAEEIKRLTAQLRATEEELRLFKEKELKQELLEELSDQLKEKGIPDESVEQMIQKEYLKNRVIPPL